MQLTEAEIQVLVSLHKILGEGRVADKKALAERGKRYWIFKEDWTGVCPALSEKGMIEGSDDGWHLTEQAQPIAAAYRTERVDMYWYYYQRFYEAAYASEAHSELCRRVFGQDLTQEGQTDMSSLRIALDALGLKPGKHLLDLGCGAGVIAEYISDSRGVRVTGLDYSSSAVAAAEARTADKRDRLPTAVPNVRWFRKTPLP